MTQFILLISFFALIYIVLFVRELYAVENCVKEWQTLCPRLSPSTKTENTWKIMPDGFIVKHWEWLRLMWKFEDLYEMGERFHTWDEYINAAGGYEDIAYPNLEAWREAVKC